MVQRVDYAIFPDVREQELLAHANRLIAHVGRTSPSFKELREWLRDANTYDKETTPVLFELLDVVNKGAKVKLGPWAVAHDALEDEEAQKASLFKRMLDQNTLLVKYVLEALDMEGGGRLHSTYELHRMLTSYVYPGEHIRLTDFQNWIKWMVASGRIKLIGIRWGLTDLGKEIAPRLRQIDVEEFLEDEAAEAEDEGDEEEAEAPAPAPAKAAAAAPAKAAAPAPAPEPATPAPAPAAKKGKAAAAAAAEGEEELPDLPPEAPPVDEDAFRAYQEQLVAENTPEPPVSRVPVAQAASAAVAVPTLPRSIVTPTSIAEHARLEVACLQEPPEPAEVIAQLRAIGRERGLGGGSLLLAYGLETRMAQNEPARHLFLASLLARLFAARPDGALATLLVERVGALGPVAILLERPEALAEVLVRWGLAMPDPASQQVRTILLDAVIGGRALAARTDLPTVLAETPTSEMLVGSLTQGLLRGAGPLAVFWLVREMVRVGLWSRPTHTEIAFVPTRAVRLMAYRLRLIESHHATSSARMLEVARRLAALLPPGSVEAAAAELLAVDDHLRFDCARLPICQQPCALHPVD